MNPPLDALPLSPPESRGPERISDVIAPHAVHDLRDHQVGELRYSATAALIIAGVPGAGKSTALKILFSSTADAEQPPRGPSGSMVLDSNHVRNAWRRRLNKLPYPLWRPLVHVVHYTRIRRALRDNAGPVVIHECATFGWARRMIAHWAAAHGRELHLILLDVPASIARAGQYARGRRINGFSFRLHCSRWQRMLHAIDSGHNPVPNPASLVIADRSTVDHLQRISFAG
ncbi:AAA family ATPase [Nocardia donostiensis]|uniref:AAA family ATPase n=1 Tax=Nocardia donostiensis TaxID=1538463 RepID=UPI001FE9074B|nr:ATP-binding protein [Nocardia donostiensis]